MDKEVKADAPLPSGVTIGIVLQARMGSTRFPGKVVQPFLKKTVVEHCVERALLVPCVHKVILAVPLATESQPILDAVKMYAEHPRFAIHAEKNEDDVLERYYQSAVAHKLDFIVRLTCDCPLHNPFVDFQVLSQLVEKDLDYTSNVYPTRTFPKGLDVEAFTFDCLEAAHVVTDAPYDREHVTSWMQRQSDDVVRKGLVKNKKDFSDVNMCIDYPGDIERVEKLVSEMSANEVFDDVKTE